MKFIRFVNRDENDIIVRYDSFSIENGVLITETNVDKLSNEWKYESYYEPISTLEVITTNKLPIIMTKLNHHD